MHDKNLHECLALDTFEERLEYLRVTSRIGLDTFGYDRYLNQQFYKSKEWRDVRHKVIVRDNGCDLGCPDRPIPDKIIIHHINPIKPKDLEDAIARALNPDELICCSLQTHNAIHYGGDGVAPTAPVERRLNDTCPWKH